MKILITGGAGFVGSNLATAFKHDHRDWEIIVLDNLYRRGSELNIPRLVSLGITFCHGDIRIKDDILELGHFDLLIECSAEPSAQAGYHSSSCYLTQTNIMGTLNCLEACSGSKADIVFLSTSRVYPYEIIESLDFEEGDQRLILSPNRDINGVSPEYGFSEKFPLDGIRSLYGASKLCSELMLKEYLNAYNLRGVINRCGVLTGPWQMGKVDQGFVALWMARHLWKGELTYIGYGGHGKQVRDILHIRDLYRLIDSQIEQLSAISGSVFNVGGGMARSLSLLELTRWCEKITGNTINIASVNENRMADIPFFINDFRKVHSIIGWQPGEGIESILIDIYDWLGRHESQLKPIFTGQTG